jgi:hypothetical protein
MALPMRISVLRVLRELRGKEKSFGRASLYRSQGWRANVDTTQMVETGLTRELIDAGAKLVEKLDERGLAPDAAFWLYSPEEEAWKLLLVEVKQAKKRSKSGVF